MHIMNNYHSQQDKQLIHLDCLPVLLCHVLYQGGRRDAGARIRLTTVLYLPSAIPPLLYQCPTHRCHLYLVEVIFSHPSTEIISYTYGLPVRQSVSISFQSMVNQQRRSKHSKINTHILTNK